MKIEIKFVVVVLIVLVFFFVLAVVYVVIMFIEEMEQCYGVLLVGENDCVVGLGMFCVGILIVDYQGNVWIYVLEGICESIQILYGIGFFELVECL